LQDVSFEATGDSQQNLLVTLKESGASALILNQFSE